MKNTKLSAALLTIVSIVALVPTAAVAAPNKRNSDASVVGRGTWTLGSAQVSCTRQRQESPILTLMSSDQCGYSADSAPSEAQSEEGCTEVAHGTIVGGCRAVLKGETQKMSGLAELCMQGGLLDGMAEYPAGPPDGRVTVYSAAMDRSFDVPVSITVSGATGHVYGTQLLHPGSPVDRIVVDGRFLWNLRADQSCPFQGGQPTPGVWQGTYTFWGADGS